MRPDTSGHIKLGPSGSCFAHQHQPCCDQLRRLNRYGGRAIPSAARTPGRLPPPAYYPYRGYPPTGYYGYRGYPPPTNYRANPPAPSQGTYQDADGQLRR